VPPPGAAQAGGGSADRSPVEAGLAPTNEESASLVYALRMLTALAGGVGAARFLAGLVQVVEPDDVTVVVNTGDDDWFHGLLVCPDLDSVTYTLAGASNPETGWGLAGETFATMDALDRYGAPTWFRLGDRDLATHLYRSDRLRAGAPLSTVTAEIAAAWDLACRLLPMTDDRVATRIRVRTGPGDTELALQEWFVRERSEPPVTGVRFDGADQARPGPGVIDAIAAADTIIVCPSNPVISIGPILAVPGVRDALAARRDRVVGVSPIVAGAPVRGPADRLMAPLGIEVSCVGVAHAYAEICATLVIDAGDASRASEVEAAGVRAVVADTMMRDARIAAALARHTLAAVA
jgi:LPPG:FO 2-phospho-L-lactate transferase